LSLQALVDFQQVVRELREEQLLLVVGVELLLGEEYQLVDLLGSAVADLVALFYKLFQLLHILGDAQVGLFNFVGKISLLLHFLWEHDYWEFLVHWF
jgi:hypothetical protein